MPERDTNINLKLACWNSRGFSAAVPFLRQLVDKNDVIMISEHWLHTNRLHMLGEINDKFNWHGVADKISPADMYGIKRGQGGTAILWDKNLKGVSVIETINHDRICGLRMECEAGMVLIFLSVYLPASSSSENLSIVLDELAGIVESLGADVIPIIGGDFNGDMGKQGGPRGRGPTTKAGALVLEFMKEHNMMAVNLMTRARGNVNTFESHNGNSTIDYVCVPKFMGKNIIACKTGNYPGLNTSDHLPIEVAINFNLLPRTMETPGGSKRLRWDKLDDAQMYIKYQRPLNEKLGNIMDRVENLVIATPELIDSTLDMVVQAIHGAAESVPRSNFAKHLKPYWCEDLKVLKKEKMFWFDKWKQQGRPRDENNHVWRRMKSSKKEFSKRVRKMSKEYHNQMVTEAARKAEVNRTDFWKMMKGLRGKHKSTYNAVKNKDDRVMYELADVLGVWKEHFNALSNPRDDPSFNRQNFHRVTENIEELRQGNDTSPFLENPFVSTEVVKVIKKLNTGKTPGHDRVTSEHVKHGGNYLVQVLCIIFNACVRVEYVPCNFRIGIQVPLYKGKNTCPLDPDNYRGITLLSTFNKMFEAVIWERVQPWWVESQAVSPLQGAARKGFSCVHTALTLQETIARQREGGKKVFVAYYDVSKAFDSV